MQRFVHSKYSLIVLAVAALGWSFWYSHGWMVLCAGLALFLFGMQNLEQGLKGLAGGQLEALLTRSTQTPVRGLLFGCLATFLLQSTTLVSLLTIAFLSTGLITLAGGLAVLFGANLGATSGIWLLALAGQNLSMSPLAMPLLVFGVLLGFVGPRAKAAGRLLLGISLIFLGIDEIKEGFSSFGDLNLARYSADGFQGALLFVGVGTLITVVVQSSHATLMLTLAALASQQLTLDQSLAIAIGSNVGSALSTAFMGMIGSNRSGQRLAAAHVVFNVATALVAFALLLPLTWLVIEATGWVGLGSNTLIQLALFHTVFNLMGVLLFWPWQRQLALWLERLLPEQEEPNLLVATQTAQITHARYLSPTALQTAESAARAVSQELQHMARLSLEVIAHALFQPVSRLDEPEREDAHLAERLQQPYFDADQLYQAHIKTVYSELLAFMGQLDVALDAQQMDFWNNSQVAAFQLVDSVKDAHRMQRNLRRYLREDTATAPYRHYNALRHHVLHTLAQLRALSLSPLDDTEWSVQLQALDTRVQSFEQAFRQQLFQAIRTNELDSHTASSLMNDLGFAHQICQGLRQALLLGAGHAGARQLQALMGTEPLLHDPL